MRVVIQKSLASSVSVDGAVIGAIEKGYVLLVGVTHDDTEADVIYCANKISKMRLFEDENDKINLSLDQVGGSILSISQFTLFADTAKGNRPSFIKAAKPVHAQALFEQFNELLVQTGLHVETGQFGAMMQVNILNDGPVTILLDSKQR